MEDPNAALEPAVEVIRGRDGDLSIGDVVDIAEAMAVSLTGFFRAVDNRIHDEFDAISAAISAVKADVAQLGVSEMREERIPDAGRELDAVVEATEEATNSIMAAAETIMAADSSDPVAYKALVDEKMIEIFEACTFQDITGQRIAKVVRTLAFIDARVTSFMEKARADAAPREARAESEAERRARELMLNGPQMKGAGVTQGAVDDFFAGGDIDQSAIDDLFA